jgi:hypothetical protein
MKNEKQAPKTKNDPGKLSRGGYRNEEDFAESSQRVRGEFLMPTFKAKATFAYDSVVFNMACVAIFPKNQHVAVNVDEPNLRIYVEPCEGGETTSLKFATCKNGKNIPRKCTARRLCEMLYEIMNWHTKAKYRTLAIEQTFFGKKIIVFNLDECLQVFTETFVDDDGTKKYSSIINMPKDWKGRFGYTPEEYEARNKIEDSAELIRIDNKTGERHGIFIEPKLPTPEELMHKPYGGIRQRTEESDAERYE